MNIVICRRADRLALALIFVEMNDYYFGDNSISVAEMTSFLEHHLFSEFSGVTGVCCRDENGMIVGVTTFSLMYPAPYATGQIYMKERFVTASARGMGVGQA
ncbi:hypothetical protein EH228_02795 [Erwinia endophytica]|uniref:hypothetical protein n=1 Tax=Erwinia endophytica TaxID=1563158 RepID=UPI001265DE50|nr:hypothetical protein [Erwinia endophytica]KAB8313091.1 hypothetical protein EH228_02795 [Erwinia endophytica]